MGLQFTNQKEIPLKIGIFYNNNQNEDYYVPMFVWKRIEKDQIEGKFLGSIIIEKLNKTPNHSIFPGHTNELRVLANAILDEGEYDLVFFYKQLNKLDEAKELEEKLVKTLDLDSFEFLTFTHFNIKKTD